MIDIEEEDKERKFKLLVLGISHQEFIHSTQELLDFKQQILQDREDAKILQELRPIIDRIYKNDQELYPINKKNLKIVKRLEERIREIKQVTFSHGPVSNINMITELQKILEGKK